MKPFYFALIYEVFSFIWIVGLLYLWTGSLFESVGINLIIVIVRIITLTLFKRYTK